MDTVVVDVIVFVVGGVDVAAVADDGGGSGVGVITAVVAVVAVTAAAAVGVVVVDIDVIVDDDGVVPRSFTVSYVDISSRAAAVVQTTSPRQCS